MAVEIVAMLGATFAHAAVGQLTYVPAPDARRIDFKLCKIWLEPNIELAKQGDLTDKQVKEVIKIAEKYQSKLLHQWKQFKKGKTIKIIKIKE